MSYLSYSWLARLLMVNRARGRLVLAALWLLVAVPLIGAACFQLARLWAYPYAHDGLEGTLLHEARLFWGGAPLYQPLERYRFVSAPYPPMHPLLLGVFDQVSGPHVFWGGRLLSLFAALGVGAGVMLLVRATTGRWSAGLLGAALLLNAPPVLLWATRIKPDMLALFWTMVGLVLANRVLMVPAGVGTPRLLLVAAVSFVLAFFTKQTALAAPLAVGLALLVGDVRDYRVGRCAGVFGWVPLRWRTVVFGVVYVVLMVTIWLGVDMASGGQFYLHVWVMHRDVPWSAGLMFKFIGLLAPYWPALLCGVGLVVVAVRSGQALVPACYVVTAPLTLIGAGETGANHNHLLETLLALALATGMVAGWSGDALGQRRVGALVPFVLLVLQFILVVRPPQWFVGELARDDSPERYVTFMRNTPGDILADDVGLLFQSGHELRYDDPISMGISTENGIWDQRGLLDDIAQRRFRAIMIPLDVEHDTFDPARRWTPEVLAAIRRHYRVLFRDTMFTYVPR